jgi:hypothetical protein
VVLVDVEVTTYFLVAPTQVLEEPCGSESVGVKSMAQKRKRINYRIDNEIVRRRRAADTHGGLVSNVSATKMVRWTLRTM